MSTPPETDGCEATAYVAALLSLPAMGPHRLRRLLDAAGSPAAAWQLMVRAGRIDFGADGPFADLRGKREEIVAGWRRAAQHVNPAALRHRHEASGVELLARGSERYPERLRDDPEPPELLFLRGVLPSLSAPTVAIVGTRRATVYGLNVARTWGRELAAMGVIVVSGLAGGIDGAAHEGVLSARSDDPSVAPPVAVVGTGVDVVYPRRNAVLWRQVAAHGAIISEAPMGTRPDRWRFPSRNRIIAGLADVVIVVESHARGGALLTADEALARDRTLFAVPGSVHSPASLGAHQLITQGAHLASGLEDILTALDACTSRRPAPALMGRLAVPLGGGSKTRGCGPEESKLLEALGWEPATLDDLVDRTGWSLGATSLVLEGLLRRNMVTAEGPWLIQGGD